MLKNIVAVNSLENYKLYLHEICVKDVEKVVEEVM